MKIQKTNRAVSLLVGDRPEIAKSTTVKMFCTISPNPNTLHPCTMMRKGKRVNVKIPYGKLKQVIQYEYCTRIIERCYVPFLSEQAQLIGTWELNKTGNVHFHFIILDPLIHNKTQLEIFRRNVLNCEDVVKNMAKGKKMTDYMNNIVFIDKPFKDVVTYCDKEYDMNKDIFMNYENGLSTSE